jgi:hypothetical protein
VAEGSGADRRALAAIPGRSLVNNREELLRLCRSVYGAICDVWEVIEALAARMATLLIGYSPPLLFLILGCWGAVDRDAARFGYCFLGLVLSLPVAVWLTLLLSRAEEARLFQVKLGDRQALPLAVATAGHIPDLPWVLRPFLAAWWLGHFGIGLLVVLIVPLRPDRAGKDWQETVVLYALPLVIGFSFTLAANIYFLLALALFERRITVLQKVWRWRLVIDIAVGLISVALLLAH